MKGNPWIQKLAGIAAAWLVSLAAQHALTLNPDEVAAIIVTVLSLVEYGVSKHTNPGNASSSHLAAKEANEVQQMKNSDISRER